MKTLRLLVILGLTSLSMGGYAQGQQEGLALEKESNEPKRVIIRDAGPITNGENKPLIIVDGIPVKNNASAEDMDLNPDDVSEISVLKGESATAIYGTRGANGVILITTKVGSRDRHRSTLSAVSEKYAQLVKEKKNDENIVYVLNKEVISKNKFNVLEELKAEDIKKVKVLSAKKARRKYKVKQAEGAVVITTK